MSQIAVTCLDDATAADWEDAVAHVVTATAIPRAELWFRDTNEGTFVFAAPPGDRTGPPEPQRPPVGWITNRTRYQIAKSRGDLEDPTAFFQSRTGVQPLCRHFSDAQPPMKNSAPSDATKTTFIAARKLVWKGRVLAAKDPFDATSEEINGALIPAWLEHGWVHREGETPKAVASNAKKPAKPAGKKAAGAKTGEPAAKVAQPARESADGIFELLDPKVIMPSPVNPRRHFDEESMVELTDSVREKGVRVAINVRPMPPDQWFLDPGTSGGKEGWFIFDRRRFYMRKAVYAGVPTQERNYHHLPWDLFEYFYPTEEAAIAAIPKYEIIAGERRWRAARRAGVTTIRAIVETMDDEEAAELQVIENDQRQDLSPIETAAGYDHLLRLPGYSMEKLVRKTGKSESTLRGKLKLLDLPEAVQTAVAKKVLAPATAEIIGRLKPEMQQKAAALILPDADEDREEALSFRDAKEVIDDLKAEEQQETLARQAADKARAEGFTVLQGEQARGVLSYSDQLVHNSGYVAAKDVCPHDPARHTWAEAVEQSEQFMAENHLFVTRYAVIANSHREGFKAVAIFARDQVNVLLKALNLWNAQGSQKSREQLEKEAAKERHGQQREAMMHDMDAIADFARRERNPRNVLLAAVWAATQQEGNTDAAEFVAKRRAWLSLDGDMGEACSVVRSMATDLENDDLQGLVVELAMAQMGDEESYFGDGRAEMRRLFDLEFSGKEETADVCEDSEGEDEALA